MPNAPKNFKHQVREQLKTENLNKANIIRLMQDFRSLTKGFIELDKRLASLTASLLHARIITNLQIELERKSIEEMEKMERKATIIDPNKAKGV